MSRENVELVRRSFDGFNRGRLKAILDFYDPEIEWITTAGYVEAGTYRGHEGVLRYLGSLEGEFEDVRIELEEVIDVDGRVVASIRSTGTGKRSRARFEFQITFVGWVRNGLFVRVRNYAEKAEALKAVGLSE